MRLRQEDKECISVLEKENIDLRQRVASLEYNALDCGTKFNEILKRLDALEHLVSALHRRQTTNQELHNARI